MILAAALALSACGGGGNGGAVFPFLPSPPTDGTQPPVVQPPVPAPTCAVAIPADAPLTAIPEIQGTGDRSPMADQTAATVRGVVVGDFQAIPNGDTRLNGFFVQSLVPDADPLSSEGLFVYAPSNATRVKVGDYVQVSGAVTEYGQTAGANAKPDSLTQIAGTVDKPVAVTVCGSDIPMAATAITLPVESETTLERYEGMLVEIAQPLAVSELFELGRYGQMVLALNGRQFNPTNGNAAATHAQNLLARIVLDDGNSRQNPNPIPYLSSADTHGTRRMGDMTQKVRGILSHNFAAYRIQPTEESTFVQANPRPDTAPAVGGTLKVASLNVLNYFTTFQDGTTAAGQTGQGCTLGSGAPSAGNCRGANNRTEFDRQQAKIVAAIAGLDADVIGLMEIQNTDVATDNLVAALNARLGAGTYDSVRSGSFGTDAIKVDILYKPARVQRVGGLVFPTGTDLTDYVAPSGRPPLAQRFAVVGNNGGFWFVVNHFKSKGSCPSTGDVDQGQGCFNLARTQQATALSSFVDKLKAQGESDVLMMGDFNSYLLEDPTRVFEAAGHESLLKRLPANDRYTYVFGGETGSLDHAYASASLAGQVSGVGVWHINADEPTAIDYNTDFTTDDRYAPTPFRASDHDPVQVGLNLAADAAVTQPILGGTIPATARAGESYVVTISDAQPGGTATLTSLSVDWGDGSAPTAATGPGTVAHTYTAEGSFNVVITLTNSAGQTATQSGTVAVSRIVVIPPGAPDLFFSEYVEGSSSNKAIELYNPTSATLDLSLYAVKLYSNGASTPTNTQALSGTLAPRATLVLANSNATAAFKPAGTITSSVVNYNGDDALTLEKSGNVIDRIGQVGFDPGTEWKSGSVGTLDQTLRRKSGIQAGDPNPLQPFDPALQWDVLPLNTSDGLGSHTTN
ncbi:ExeM/NucH family extracellular endonuclease [Xenophilus arseniciresistens]|uniref:ExeM/NucH family extracellular endonuclease n=1 Tax=Xenophilus arseniciresistens TaxID=1283306 RepID=A0AAE3NBX3_9BURK|nr:ExeM/NucH family extracellular endonuclease [Xenophilus arseniciresistens]MDA7418016.1 ExeM/NucH family extracellular endonuclease [Xenophilus arseniciresistens]